MADEKAKEIVDLRNREKAKQSNFRSHWQEISDMGCPFIHPITDTYAPGSELMQNIYDPTMMEEGENMASGLSNNLMPAGQQFFLIRARDRRIQQMQNVRRYFSELTEISHEALANSNFLSQTDMSLLMWLQFGMACNYADWTVKTGLNYRDYGIGAWQAMENAQGIIDTIIMTVPRTARQCVQQFGIQNVGKSVVEAYNKPETRNDSFNVIHLVRPRAERDQNMIDNRNMAFESIYVSEKDDHTIEEGGFEEFPFAMPRYRVIYAEVYGRGQGSIALRLARTLNRAVMNFDEAAEKWVKPPLEVLESFDGDVDVSPNAQNPVTEMNSIRAIDVGVRGSFPIGKDWIQYRTERLQQIYFKNVFEQLSMLTGDRRTTVEIIERLKEGLKKMSKPIARLFVEYFDPIITRSVLLLIRNGQAPPPPPELSGQNFKIDYIGPLSLALRDQQSKGLQYWIAALGQMEPIFPGVKDNVEYDKAARDLGESLGVKTDHIRPIRQRDEIRAARQQAIQAQRQAEMLSEAAQGYKSTKEAAEKGSPAEQVQSAMQGAI
jgi:hypothetical protein